MADFKPPSTPGSALGPPTGPSALRPQFQIPQPPGMSNPGQIRPPGLTPSPQQLRAGAFPHGGGPQPGVTPPFRPPVSETTPGAARSTGPSPVPFPGTLPPVSRTPQLLTGPQSQAPPRPGVGMFNGPSQPMPNSFPMQRPVVSSQAPPSSTTAPGPPRPSGPVSFPGPGGSAASPFANLGPPATAPKLISAPPSESGSNNSLTSSASYAGLANLSGPGGIPGSASHTGLSSLVGPGNVASGPFSQAGPPRPSPLGQATPISTSGHFLNGAQRSTTPVSASSYQFGGPPSKTPVGPPLSRQSPAPPVTSQFTPLSVGAPQMPVATSTSGQLPLPPPSSSVTTIGGPLQRAAPPPSHSPLPQFSSQPPAGPHVSSGQPTFGTLSGGHPPPPRSGPSPVPSLSSQPLGPYNPLAPTAAVQPPFSSSQGVTPVVGPPSVSGAQSAPGGPPHMGPPLPGPPLPNGPPMRPPMSNRYPSAFSGPPTSSSGVGQAPPMMNQQNFMPPAPPSSNYSGINGPSAQGMQPPPPTSQPGMPPLPPQPARPGMPPPIHQQPQQTVNGMSSRLGGLSLYQGMEPVDLLQNRHILPSKPEAPPKPRLAADAWNKANCSPDIFRCTVTKIPETEALLKKARVPLGIIIHPFRDLSHLPVIQCSTIVRCRQCRTYINPFVTFVDQRRWRCNICYRVNELPEEFLYDPVSKSYGDPSRRPECKSSTIEFIAPSEYMLRPPQPAVYVFLLDTSRQAIETGYLKVFCDVLLDEISNLPGDSRTQIAFITFDSCVRFYMMPDRANRPTQLTVTDIDDIFLPSPTDLLVNLNESRNLVVQLLMEMPEIFTESHATDSALGAALQAAYKIASPTGGRVSVFQHILPRIGPGALPNREMKDESKGSAASLLGPATDFYKKLALDCSGQQVAMDLIAMGSQYQDLATLSGISKFSGGQILYFPGYHLTENPAQAAKFEHSLRRYLTRKIGFEAVMRVRCTRGLTLQSFHGNFFVRSTDLLSLPNVNPDSAFGIQVAIEEDLRDSREVSFQAALLYTSSKGERRIRVHTLCLPTTASINDVINAADEQAIIGMLTKFASDRAMSDSLSDAKEGLVVSCVDTIETYKTQASMSIPNGLLISPSLKLLPLHVLACLRSIGFRPGTKLDERSFCLAQFKSLPIQQLMQLVYPDLYRVDNLSDEGALREEGGDSSDEDGPTEIIIPQPDRLQLSFERISATGMYLMDLGDIFYLYLSRGLHAYILEKCFGVTRLMDVKETLTDLPELNNQESERLRTFVQWLNGQKPFPAPIKIIREDGKSRYLFVEKMIEDRLDKSFSYFEFLQHIKQQVK